MPEDSEFATEKPEEFHILTEIRSLIDRLNPYKPTLIDKETGKPLEKKRVIYYRKLVSWMIDVILNGIFLFIAVYLVFVLYVLYKGFGIPALGQIIKIRTIPIFILGMGIFLWYVKSVLIKFYDYLINGLSKVAGSFRFK